MTQLLSSYPNNPDLHWSEKKEKERARNTKSFAFKSMDFLYCSKTVH